VGRRGERLAREGLRDERDTSGSTATLRICLPFVPLMYRLTPVRVPPSPRRSRTRPPPRPCRPRSRGRWWTRGWPGFAGFSNCFVRRSAPAPPRPAPPTSRPRPSSRAGPDQHQSRPEGHEHLAPLHAHRLRHGEHAVVPARRRSGRPARCRCSRSSPRAGPSPASGRLASPRPTHRRADAALHRVGRVPTLDLREHGRPRVLRQVVDAHERRAGRSTRRLSSKTRPMLVSLPGEPTARPAAVPQILESCHIRVRRAAPRVVLPREAPPRAPRRRARSPRARRRDGSRVAACSRPSRRPHTAGGEGRRDVRGAPPLEDGHDDVGARRLPPERRDRSEGLPPAAARERGPRPAARPWSRSPRCRPRPARRPAASRRRAACARGVRARCGPASPRPASPPERTGPSTGRP